jgi:hypothetical protein
MRGSCPRRAAADGRQMKSGSRNCPLQTGRSKKDLECQQSGVEFVYRSTRPGPLPPVTAGSFRAGQHRRRDHRSADHQAPPCPPRSAGQRTAGASACGRVLMHASLLSLSIALKKPGVPRRGNRPRLGPSAFGQSGAVLPGVPQTTELTGTCGLVRRRSSGRCRLRWHRQIRRVLYPKGSAVRQKRL